MMLLTIFMINIIVASVFGASYNYDSSDLDSEIMVKKSIMYNLAEGKQNLNYLIDMFCKTYKFYKDSQFNQEQKQQMISLMNSIKEGIMKIYRRYPELKHIQYKCM